MELASLLSAVMEAHSRLRGTKQSRLSMDSKYLESHAWIYDESLGLIDVIQVRENVRVSFSNRVKLFSRFVRFLVYM